MRTKICSQCQKTFEPVRNASLCSEPCRKAAKKASDNESRVRGKVRAAKMRRIKASNDFNPYELTVGTEIGFGYEEGTIIAVVKRGETIAGALTALKEADPELYDAKHSLPPEGAVGTVRYIVRVDKLTGIYVRWPYLYSISGVSHGKSEENNEAQEDHKAEERAQA